MPRSRRVLSLVAAVLTVAAALAYPSGPAFTAGSRVLAPVFSDIQGSAGEFELSALGALGVFSGDSGLGGPVRPRDPITRDEFCKVVVEATGKTGIAASLASLRPLYTDADKIPPWAWGYVNAALMMGVVDANPYGDGAFRPDSLVTYAEGVTMVVRGVPSHDAWVPEGQWPSNYLAYAGAHGFLAGVDMSSPNAPCSRGDMAALLLASMRVNRRDPFGAETPDSAVLKGRVFSAVLLDYSVGESVNIMVLDYNGDGLADVEEYLNLAPRVGLGLASSLEGLKGHRVTAMTGVGETADLVVFVGAGG